MDRTPEGAVDYRVVGESGIVYSEGWVSDTPESRGKILDGIRGFLRLKGGEMNETASVEFGPFETEKAGNDGSDQPDGI